MPDGQAVVSGQVTRPRHSDVRYLLITWHPCGRGHLLGSPPSQDSKADRTRHQRQHAGHEEGECAQSGQKQSGLPRRCHWYLKRAPS